MPMSMFAYGQGEFLTMVNEVMKWERASLPDKLDPNSGLDVQQLAQMRASWENPKPRRLKPEHLDHFVDHWLTQAGNGSVAFPKIPPARIKEVLKEGFRQAVDKAAGLPISVAWIIRPGVFEVVTILNPGIHAQVLIVTPVPLAPRGGNAPDDVHVTQYFATQEEIDDVLGRLGYPADPLTITNPQGAPATPGEVGTFEVRR